MDAQNQFWPQLADSVIAVVVWGTSLFAGWLARRKGHRLGGDLMVLGGVVGVVGAGGWAVMPLIETSLSPVPEVVFAALMNVARLAFTAGVIVLLLGLTRKPSLAELAEQAHQEVAGTPPDLHEPPATSDVSRNEA